MSHFEYEQSRDGLWYWRLRDGNGEIICHGEGYSSEDALKRGLENVKIEVARTPLPWEEGPVRSSLRGLLDLP